MGYHVLPTFVPVEPTDIRTPHASASAYVSIRQHTSAYAHSSTPNVCPCCTYRHAHTARTPERQHTSASASVSIRQHSCTYGHANTARQREQTDTKTYGKTEIFFFLSFKKDTSWSRYPHFCFFFPLFWNSVVGYLNLSPALIYILFLFFPSVSFFSFSGTL